MNWPLSWGMSGIANPGQRHMSPLVTLLPKQSLAIEVAQGDYVK